MNASVPGAAPKPLELIDAVEGLSRGAVLIVGDIMLDEYLTGDAERISPEAPVPVVLVEKEARLLGGAGNVARNIAALGGGVALVGVCGADRAGDELLRALKEDGIPSDMLRLAGRSTTVKTRVLARQQQVVRIDRESAGPLPDADAALLLEKAARVLPSCGAVVVSDYGKGVVSRYLMHGLRALCAADGRGIPVLVDPKPQNIDLYQGVTLLTPNAKETSEASRLPVGSPDEIAAAGRAIMRRLGCEHLVTTLGSRGMAVFEDPSTIWHIPTVARQVFDVTGAGDTVIAALALGAASGLPLVPACLLANYAAGIVVGHVGAATVTPNQLAEAVATLPRPSVERWGV